MKNPKGERPRSNCRQPRPAEEPWYLDLRTAAGLVGVSGTTLQRAARDRPELGLTVRIGGRVLFRRDRLREVIERGELA